MAPPSTSSTSPHPPRSHLFTPIQEGNESEETEPERHRFKPTPLPLTPASSASSTSTSTHRQLTPLHEPGHKKPPKSQTQTRTKNQLTEPTAILCNNCRPTPRSEKHSVVTVVPVNNAKNSLSVSSSSPSPSPNNPNLFKSFLSNISRRSPKPDPSPTQFSTPDENYRVTVDELSHKLVLANRKRDEAIIESSKLKYSLAELEKKLNRLELYCHSLKSGLDKCHVGQSQNQIPGQNQNQNQLGVIPIDGVVIKSFLVAVSEGRSSIRFLSRALTSQLKLMGAKVFERILQILRSYDIKITSNYCNNNPKGLQFYLEALLSVTFYEDFESVGFLKNSVNRVLNPMDRAESNYEAFKELKELAWEEVLNKGTKHFSEEFSKFCDRKMSEIVTLLGWSRAWPEQLLQAFFGASKSVWLVHLLANSVHPSLTIFRVEKGARFDPVYMEDMGGDKAKKLIPTVVRIMVAPGFYVYDNVVKCKVVCRYYDSNYNEFSANDM